MTEFPDYYILVNRLPVAVDMWTWARFFEKIENRQIGDTRIDKVRVSTVFLGLNHNLGGGDPVLFETMIFGGPLNNEQWRYTTYKDAERGHTEAVTQARIAAAQIKSIADKAGTS